MEREMSKLIIIQDELVERVLASARRWQRQSIHRRNDEIPYGHFWRTKRAARRQARQQLETIGCYTPEQTETIINDALDIAELELIGASGDYA